MTRVGQGGIDSAVSDSGAPRPAIAINDSIGSALLDEELHTIDDGEELADIDRAIWIRPMGKDSFSSEHIDALSFKWSGVAATGSIDGDSGEISRSFLVRISWSRGYG